MTTDRSISACSARCTSSGARVVGSRPGPGGDAGGGDAPDAADRGLARALDDGRAAAGARAARAERRAGARRRGAVRAARCPVDAAGLDFYTVSGQKWLCGPGRDRCARRRRAGAAARSRGRATSRRPPTSRRAASCRRRARRGSTRLARERRPRRPAGGDRDAAGVGFARAAGAGGALPRAAGAARRGACPATRRSSPSARRGASRRVVATRSRRRASSSASSRAGPRARLLGWWTRRGRPAAARGARC